MTKIINLYGGPGTGKSSCASDLFAHMKWVGESVELVSEFAKDLTWDGHFDILADQLWVSANQNRRIQRLMGKVDYIITDSPLGMCEIYAGEYFPTFVPLIRELHEHYDNVEIFLRRIKPYVAKGRSQDEDGARQLDQQIKSLFKKRGYFFDLEVDATRETKYTIYEYLKSLEE